MTGKLRTSALTPTLPKYRKVGRTKKLKIKIKIKKRSLYTEFRGPKARNSVRGDFLLVEGTIR
jgi:hypothetical protein